jgi:hypothetical protein
MVFKIDWMCLKSLLSGGVDGVDGWWPILKVILGQAKQKEFK